MMKTEVVYGQPTPECILPETIGENDVLHRGEGCEVAFYLWQPKRGRAEMQGNVMPPGWHKSLDQERPKWQTPICVYAITPA